MHRVEWRDRLLRNPFQNSNEDRNAQTSLGFLGQVIVSRITSCKVILTGTVGAPRSRSQ